MYICIDDTDDSNDTDATDDTEDCLSDWPQLQTRPRPHPALVGGQGGLPDPVRHPEAELGLLSLECRERPPSQPEDAALVRHRHLARRIKKGNN